MTQPVGRSLAHTFVSLLSANVGLAGISLVTSLALAKGMGARGYGGLSYSLALGGYLLTFANAGFNQTLIRDLVQRPRLRSRLVSASLCWRLGLAGMGGAVLLVIVSFTGLVRPLGLDDWGLILAFALPVLTLAPLFDAWGEFRLHTVLHVVERMVYFSLVWAVLLFVPAELSVGVVAAALGMGGLVGLFLQGRFAFERLRPILDGRAIRLGWLMVQRNVWIWGSALAQLSFGTLSKIVLGNGAGDVALGGYAIAWQVVTVGSVFTAQASRIGNPRLMSLTRDGDPGARERFLLRYVLAMVGVGSFVAVPAFLIPAPVLGYLGPEYVAAAPVLKILGAYVLLVAVGQVGLQYLIAVRLEWVYGLTLLSTAVVSMVLLSILVPTAGAVGAALAVVCSHGVGVLIYLFVMVRHLRSVRTADSPTPVATT